MKFKKIKVATSIISLYCTLNKTRTNTHVDKLAKSFTSQVANGAGAYLWFL